MATMTMNKGNHDETVREGIVLIDFWASWCGPCRRFAPIYESISEKHPEITFAKVDTEDQTELAGAYGIQAIPTLVIYRDGIPVFGQPGAMPEAVVEDLIAQVEALDMTDVKAKYEAQLSKRQTADSA